MKQTAIMRVSNILCIVYAVIYALVAIAAAGGCIYMWYTVEKPEIGEGLAVLGALFIYIFLIILTVIAFIILNVCALLIVLHVCTALIGKEIRSTCLEQSVVQQRYIVIDSYFKIFCSLRSFSVFYIAYDFVNKVWVLAVGIALACILALPSILNLSIGIWKKYFGQHRTKTA